MKTDMQYLLNELEELREEKRKLQNKIGDLETENAQLKQRLIRALYDIK